MVKAFIFDFWGTLVANGTYSPLKQSQSIMRMNIPFGEFVVRFEKAGMTKNFEEQREVFAAVCDEFGVRPTDFLVDRLIGVWNKNKLLAKPYPDTIGALQALKEKGVKLAILSNTPVFSAGPVMEKFDLAKFFDGVFLSCDIGYLKTDKEAFDVVFDKLGVTKDDVIMVGDSTESDMAGAKNAGVKGILIDRKGRREYESKILSLNELAAMA